jgi:hypothetical protein
VKVTGRETKKIWFLEPTVHEGTLLAMHDKLAVGRIPSNKTDQKGDVLIAKLGDVKHRMQASVYPFYSTDMCA